MSFDISNSRRDMELLLEEQNFVSLQLKMASSRMLKTVSEMATCARKIERTTNTFSSQLEMASKPCCTKQQMKDMEEAFHVH